MDPQEHSLHCLLDVDVCVGSTYHILEEPSEEGGMYGTGWAISDSTELVTMGRALGSVDDGCTTCEGTGVVVKGLTAEVKGTVVSLDPPVMDATSVKILTGGEQGCPEMTSTTDGDDMEPEATDAPTSGAGVRKAAAWTFAWLMTLFAAI